MSTSKHSPKEATTAGGGHPQRAALKTVAGKENFHSLGPVPSGAREGCVGKAACPFLEAQ